MGTDSSNGIGSGINAAPRETLRIVVTGHVDHGKSTVIGRLLYDTGSIPQGAIDKAMAASKERGLNFEFAFLLDAFEEERKQGITIDTTRLSFSTDKRDYLIIDAPGHVEFLKNMISGASDAECAFLVVDAARGVEEQSKRHAHMLRLLGIPRVGVLVNKMDLVGYSEETFAKIVEELGDYLAALGMGADVFVPLSALSGENILKASDRLPWHKGPTLLGALDGIAKGPSEDGLRLPVQDVYKFDERRIIAGRVESGSLREGDTVLISPGGRTSRVLSLESWLPKDRRTSARAPESVGITLEDEFFNQRGDIVSHQTDPPVVAARLRASVFWMGKEPLRVGRRYKLKVATASTDAVIDAIHSLIDSGTLAPSEGAREVGLNQVAEVGISLRKALALDPFASHKATGRFVLVDGYDVAGGGIVTLAMAQEPARHGFVKGALSARSEVFEEYYLSFGTREVTKSPGDAPALYGVGDRVPLSGDSYEYPYDFDIVVFRDRVAVLIRDGRVQDILRLDDYSFQGLPLVNGSGYKVIADSEESFRELRDAFLSDGPKNEAALAQRHLDFNAYRRIAFSKADYSI
ncbi:MAG: GTP-binding protein [Deltaproteobacteria bacterium]|jgi:sulfate adenylyltransferase large subunit|nr:GTP-binding protein [Deltaproteobacteria bacterium]